jgi:hypothetical protein
MDHPTPETSDNVSANEKDRVCMMERERSIFSSFITACPDFADETIKEWFTLNRWYEVKQLQRPAAPFDNRLDIFCVTESGKTIGVELKSWVNEAQIAGAKLQEMFQESILKSLGTLPRNQHRFIRRVWLRGKPQRVDRQDAEQLKTQLSGLLKQADDAWQTKKKFDQNSREMVRDLTGFPILRKYFDSVELFPRREALDPAVEEKFPDVHWVTFPNRASFYVVEDMLTPLEETLKSIKNDDRYKGIRECVGLDEIHLLIHYDFNAFAYNTPADAPDFSFGDAANFGTKVIENDGGHFNRVFLFKCIVGEEEVYRLA